MENEYLYEGYSITVTKYGEVITNHDGIDIDSLSKEEILKLYEALKQIVEEK